MDGMRTAESWPLPDTARVLAVVAHPDDESFGLGAIIDGLTARGNSVAVLCFTHGEASTLRAVAGQLHRIRARELTSAALILGVRQVILLDFADGALAVADPGRLTASVLGVVAEFEPTHLLVFDDTGITGHPDHIAATQAALRAAQSADVPVLAWTLPAEVADALNAEFGSAFAGHLSSAIDIRVPVSRDRQRRAIAAHASQSHGNAVVSRRLALLAGAEHLRWLQTL
jgi:LmbE family N-acetylglucosaminyl deacetylase